VLNEGQMLGETLLAYCAHKRFNSGSTEARVVVINSRIMKAIGFDWFDQLEPAKGFEDLWVPPAD
jgi:hypothetical protein